MKKLLFCLLIASSTFTYKVKGMLVNRDTFFENVIGFKEPEFQNNPGNIKAAIEWASTADSTKLRNPTSNKLFSAGKFKAMSIGQLRTAPQNKVSSTPGRFNVIEALSPFGKSYYEYVDISTLQADKQNQDAVFQVASNFNALELTSRDDPMSLVTNYIYDKTQGPFASISAAPGTILRHYYMFYNPTTDPSTWQQYAIQDKLWQKSDNKTQINLLENTDIPIVNSYVAFDEKSPDQVKNYKIEDIQVGWHEGIQVTSGLMAGKQHTLVDDPAQLINQVFTAAVDFGSNAAYRNNPIAIAIAQAIQDAAYEGAIRAAVAHDKKKVILTLIGGGVFANKLAWIANALEKIKDFIIASGVDVTLIIFDGEDYRLADQIDEFRARMLKLVQDTNGKYIQYSPENPQGKTLTLASKAEPKQEQNLEPKLLTNPTKEQLELWQKGARNVETFYKKGEELKLTNPKEALIWYAKAVSETIPFRLAGISDEMEKYADMWKLQISANLRLLDAATELKKEKKYEEALDLYLLYSNNPKIIELIERTPLIKEMLKKSEEFINLQKYQKAQEILDKLNIIDNIYLKYKSKKIPGIAEFEAKIKDKGNQKIIDILYNLTDQLRNLKNELTK